MSVNLPYEKYTWEKQRQKETKKKKQVAKNE